MSSFTTFQNQGFDPSRNRSSPGNPNSFSNTSFTSPPLPAQSSHRNSPIRRKPLPPGATPLSPLTLGSRISDLFPKPPTHRPFASAAREPSESSVEALPTPEGSLAADPNRLYREDHNPGQHWSTQSITSRIQLSTFRSPGPPNHARFISESSLNTSRRVTQSSEHTRSASASTMVAVVQPFISLPDDPTDRDHRSFDHFEDTSKQKSPSNRFTAFFRWGSTSEQGNGPELVFSAQGDRRMSPSLSPKSTNLPPLAPANAKFAPPAIDVPLANAGPPTPLDGMFVSSSNPFPPLTPTSSSVEAIEQEVRAVSADLAASIRREMDLEDLIERLQAEAAERGSNGRRTSDYFSDSGTPVRILDTDNKDPDMEKLVRKVEQEKAQLRLDMLGKVQEERERRKAVELQVKELEELVVKSSAGLHLLPLDPPAQLKDLEMALEEAKRKLTEERLTKENFEDLLTALKEELEANRNERDNLRDKVIPQLRARVEGLETEASELQKHISEHSHMQQELTSLKTENASLAAAIREKARVQNESLAESHSLVFAQQAQLVQIQTQAQNRHSMSGIPSGYATPRTPTNGIALPLNPKDRESLAERLKDVEVQRDALHKALKSLRDRQQIEARKSKERIKALESERDRALNPSLRKQGRDKEVSALRREIDRLRQRADDALEQKFVCERSLGTLKMDLEKAEQETSTLRVLLQEQDDLIAQHDELKEAQTQLSREVSELKQGIPAETPSVSLQQAYRDLQALHERSLARLDELESKRADVSERERTLSDANEESQRAIEQLRKNLTSAEIERDTAVVEAEASRKRAESLQRSEAMQLQEERNLASQLCISSARVEELAIQVRAQISSNATLRERLAKCIERGEVEQRASAKKINDLQDKLRKLEDTMVEAQQKAEDAVSQHEDEMRRIKETHTSQLRRLKASTVKSHGLNVAPSLLLRSPRLEWTSIKRLSASDASQTELLQKRVTELERALGDADDEMAEVVGRMNAAQIEVLELQTERDEALRQTRRLQTEFVALRAKSERFI